MRLRVYPDVHEPGTWCVDKGTNATERRFRRVLFFSLSGTTASNPEADNESEPRYWISIKGHLISIRWIAAIL